MVLLAGQIGFYNWRVTGNPLVMPYVVHEETFGIAPLFLFGTPRPEPVYRHLKIIQRLQEDYLRYYRKPASFLPSSLVRATGAKIWGLCQGYLWSYLMAVVLIGLPWALMRDRWLWFALFIGIFFVFSVMMGTWVFPHYAAPAAGLFFVLVLQSMRSLNAWRWGTLRPGRNLVRGLSLLFLISVIHMGVKMAGQDRGRWYFRRQEIVDKLKAEPWKSLIIVKYSADHNPNREWVYNGADLADSKVILARDLGARNAELFDYFRDRKIWVLNADAEAPDVMPYPDAP